MKSIVIFIVGVLTPVLSLAQSNNGFEIGMFGFRPMFDQNANCQKTPVSVTEVNGFNSSTLNVLKEDGFTISFSYQYPGYHRKQEQLKKTIDLYSANNMQIMANVNLFYKSDDDNCSLSGTAVFNGSTNHDNECGNQLRPNYLKMFDNVFNTEEYSSAIWGYHVTEEPEKYNPVNPEDDYTYHLALAYPDIYDREQDIDAVEDAMTTFKTLKIPEHRTVQMHAMHAKSITQYLEYDVEGPLVAPDFMELENRCDVFFEGSYDAIVMRPEWAHMNYSDIFKIGWNDENYTQTDEEGIPCPLPTWSQTDYSLNNKHYLGFLESINYGKTLFSEVHKVLNCKTGDSQEFGLDVLNLSANSEPKNGGWLWFGAYSSIIHGVNGIWFFQLDNMFLANENQKKNAMEAGAYGVNAFDRASFPVAYKKYVAPLVREISYLANEGFLDLSSDTEILTKLNSADEYCIVDHPSNYYFFSKYGWELGNSYLQNRQDHLSENYGLRYTVRSNGSETIMIITNVLNEMTIRVV